MKWGFDGWHGVAALSSAKAKIVVDLSVPTDRQLPDRRPDIVLYLKGERKIVILEGAVTWEPLLAEQERPRADLAIQHRGWRVVVVPIVAGCLGTLREMRANLYGLGLFTRWEVARLAREIQYEVLCSGVRLAPGWMNVLQRHT